MISSARGIENLWRSYFYFAGLEEENKRLEETANRLRGRIVKLREAHLENDRLKTLLKFRTHDDLDFTGAKIVAWGRGPWFKSITIDRGSIDGVRTGMPVISANGVVGRTIEVSPRFSKVLLVTDYNSSIDAVIQRTRVRGVFTGRSENYCDLKYVRNTDDIRVGDEVVTSGAEGMFPRGMALGTISKVKKVGHAIFMEIDVAPAIDFDYLEEVLVVITEKPPF